MFGAGTFKNLTVEHADGGRRLRSPLRAGTVCPATIPTIVYGDFAWDDVKAAANVDKHGVGFEEASTVFDDRNALDAPDLLEPARFVILGRSHQERVLFVVHAERGARIRIISARKASPAQRKKYEEDR